MTKRCILVTFLGIFGALLAVPADAQGQNQSVIEPAYTKPYKKYSVHFMRMGKISEVKVKEGDVVKAGQELMKQDTSIEESELAILKFDAENKKPIEAAQAKLDLAIVEFTAKDNLFKVDPTRKLEWERANAEKKVAQVQVEQAEVELKQKELKYKQQEAVVKNMTLRADAPGVVTELVNDLGTTADPTRPSLVIVQTDPLTVVLRLPGKVTLPLKPGEKLRVSYDKKNWQDATVSFLSPEADPMTQLGQRTIHLELPNPQGAPSGLQVFVELPGKLLANQNANAAADVNANAAGIK